MMWFSFYTDLSFSQKVYASVILFYLILKSHEWVETLISALQMGKLKLRGIMDLHRTALPPQALGTSLWTQHIQGLPSAASGGAHLGWWSWESPAKPPTPASPANPTIKMLGNNFSYEHLDSSFSYKVWGHTSLCVCVSHFVASNSMWPHGLKPARLSPWNSPGKNTQVGSHFLFQWIFPNQGSNPVLCIVCRLFTIWATREAHTDYL